MRRREEYAYVLDVIPPELATYRLPARVRRDFPRDSTYAHLVGEEHFTLLEVTLKPGAKVEVGERVYVGAGQRDKVDKIVRRIKYDELQPPAREALPQIVRAIVLANEKKFVDWFNRAGPLTLKMHSLELLEGIGKKKAQEILAERRKKPFESFEDVKKRVEIDPVELIVNRILAEIQGKDPYYLFAAPPPQEAT
ncbi:MAG: DUF655 domain-containing protein [Thermoproteus sp. AZ2]|jgi:putative nucleotide binding protein|uniref:DUF655 domain-containing protein n=1 Tax=Thermoproteus sp. AZ2 TaxID=1609232 RepID=A0ACC6V0D6_9CREN|nr:MAG: hypothetical protein TU35_02905 [Thermoproteus sp. AZ2]